MEEATFAGGCFWCIEAPFKRVEGVESVTSGYTGGDTEDPTYEEVCSGKTGHSEAVRVGYDTDAVSYRELLELFFALHDPTTLNREGPDVGSQYRSAVFYHDDDQREEVEAYIDELEGDAYDGIVTEVSPAGEFYAAEEYHQDYYERNTTADGDTTDAYCRVNVRPKVEKLNKDFADLTPE